MQRFSFLSTDGKTELAAYRLVPENPRLMVQISHGMCEYLLRYRELAAYFAGENILVFGHDHLGHGATAANARDLGFTVHGGGADCLVEDVYTLAQKMKTEYPDLPVVLFGHSMGSFIARAVVERHPDTYCAAVFCGTCGGGMPTGAGKALAKLLMLFYGEEHRSGLMKKIAFAGYNKTYEKPCDENAWLSRDEAVVKAYNEDPLCGFPFTLRAYHDLFTLIARISRREWAGSLPKELPVLITGGEADPVGAYGKGLREVADALRDAGMSDVTLKLYPEMRHEIHNELEKERVWEDLRAWILSKQP